jgi:hypothetical protein
MPKTSEAIIMPLPVFWFGSFKFSIGNKLVLRLN